MKPNIMSNKHVYQLFDESNYDYEQSYLVGIFDSITSAEAYLNTIKEPIDGNGSEFNKLVLYEVKLNEVEWAMGGKLLLKVEVGEELTDEDEWGWEVTKWQRKPEGEWELINKEMYKK